MNAWRACVRLWAFGSAAWLIYWIWRASQCTSAINGYLLCPTTNGEGVAPTNWLRLGLTVLGPILVPLAVGLLLRWWTMRGEQAGGATPGGSA
jgi:hypothetical protein